MTSYHNHQRNGQRIKVKDTSFCINNFAVNGQVQCNSSNAQSKISVRLISSEMDHYDELTSLLQRDEKIPSKYDFVKIISPFMLLQMSVGLCASLQATFYPIEAELKGASPAEYGAVFGIIHLSLFIFGKKTLNKFYSVL